MGQIARGGDIQQVVDFLKRHRNRVNGFVTGQERNGQRDYYNNQYQRGTKADVAGNLFF